MSTPQTRYIGRLVAERNTHRAALRAQQCCLELAQINGTGEDVAGYTQAIERRQKYLAEIEARITEARKGVAV